MRIGHINDAMLPAAQRALRMPTNLSPPFLGFLPPVDATQLALPHPRCSATSIVRCSRPGAFLGVLHWAVPRLTLKPVLSVGLSYFIFAAWQVVVLGTAVGILIGRTVRLAFSQERQHGAHLGRGHGVVH